MYLASGISLPALLLCLNLKKEVEGEILVKKKFRTITIRTITSWVLVSLMLQFPFYYFLNNQIEKVMAPVDKPIVIQNLEAEILGTNLQDLQISYAKDYLAYKENGVLKVFNLKQNKVVFEKKPPAGSGKDMGILYYQWLPDRNTLVYFYARKNPNPVTTVVVPVTPEDPQKPTQQAPKKDNSTTSSTPKSQSQQVPPSTNVKTQSNEKLEDPNQGQTTQSNNQRSESSEATTPQTRIEKRYNNPQITELFSLELPPSDEEGTAPDDRYNRSIDSFPAGGEITQMVVSTFTNLMYLTIKTGTSTQLMEIDIMKNVRTLNRTGEVITQMAASDKFGTLYVKSKSGKTEQILALQGWEREVISKDAQDVILGDRAGTIYLGKVQDGQLINIRSASDTSDDKGLNFETIWEGSIPYKAHKGVIIGGENEIVIYDNETAYIVKDGKDVSVSLEGEENFISPDGVELIQITRVGTSTKIKLQPLKY